MRHISPRDFETLKSDHGGSEKPTGILELLAPSPALELYISKIPISKIGGCRTSILRQLASFRTRRSIFLASLVVGKSHKGNWLSCRPSLAGKIDGKVSVNSGLNVFILIPHSEFIIGVKKRAFWMDGELLIRSDQQRETRWADVRSVRISTRARIISKISGVSRHFLVVVPC